MYERLTPRTKAVYVYLRWSIQGHGHVPSIREIRDELGFKSTSGVVHHLRLLEAAGKIQRGAKGQKRAITLPPLDAIAANNAALAAEVERG